MYKSFYNLTRNPFDLSPDPTCFVATERHNEALAALYYGIVRHKGVVVVTGEVGTGKTLMLRCLLQLFKSSSEISYAYLFNCRLSALEFLHYVASDFGLKVDGQQSKSTLLLELSKYVTSRGLQGLTTVLIVDEAHNLSMELLEEIRLLSNLETNDDKLLQIVLVGQPELDLKLDSFELRPLKQRIALRAHLSPLDEQDTGKYILERLMIAGGTSRTEPLFSPGAVKAIHKYSRGFPRLINTICENSLITGYAGQMPNITSDVVVGVAKDFHLTANGNGSMLGKESQGADLDLERAKNFFLDLYASMHRPNGTHSELNSPITVEAGKMSQIFDALQRSEAERNGSDPAAAARAVELLQRAESFAAANRVVSESHRSWNTTVVAETGVAVAELKPEPEVGVAADIHTAGTVTAGSTLPLEGRVEGPMQCEVLSISASPEGHLVSLPDSESPAAEAFHLLGVRLRHMRRQRPLKKVLVTSTIPQEGKSMVAANLACTLALRTQQKVLLLEGDVRRPTQSKIFGIRNKPGICEWLNGERSLIKSMYRLDGPGIWIFPAGNGTGNSLELLQSGGATPLMEQLMSWFDWVVIDSPPILPLADTSVWTNMADGILLVTRQGTTHKRQLKRGLEALGTQKLIGAVLNSAKSVAHTDYYYRPANRLPNDDAES